MKKILCVIKNVKGALSNDTNAYLCGRMKGGALLKGLRLYPMNLIRTVPAEGLDFELLVYPFSFGSTN